MATMQCCHNQDSGESRLAEGALGFCGGFHRRQATTGRLTQHVTSIAGEINTFISPLEENCTVWAVYYHELKKGLILLLKHQVTALSQCGGKWGWMFHQKMACPHIVSMCHVQMVPPSFAFLLSHPFTVKMKCLFSIINMLTCVNQSEFHYSSLQKQRVNRKCFIITSFLSS
jgi:hypothetical protein